MNVYNMTQESIPAVAELMCTMKPEWWDYEGAFSQLSDINESIKTIGWYLGEDSGHPAGWILCRELVGLRALNWNAAVLMITGFLNWNINWADCLIRQPDMREEKDI